LASNGIDLAKRPVEVSPIAHYHMGGIRVDERMATRVARLFAAGEAVGGANGANRLSGNAIPEALVFGERAGRFAAGAAKGARPGWVANDAKPALDALAALKSRARPADAPAAAETGRIWRELQTLMWHDVGLLRSEAGLSRALDRIRALRAELAHFGPSAAAAFNTELQEWFDLRAALTVAESVALAAINRRESRGAHQREDFAASDPAFEKTQILCRDGETLVASWAP
jgi:succinate dehydrogenase/fumarate reductase flavoprotein subunit